MTGQPSRQLAVILHADVVGSTELVQRDESVAHARIRDAFRRLGEAVEGYGGTTREVRGDALVAEFARASDAVTAAIAFQADEARHYSGRDDEMRAVLRIGVSLGEVIIADGTVTGAGVVLAQRLEQLAEPGEVVVQGSVSETVPVRLPFEFVSLGEQTLKGFDQPVRAFAVRLKTGGAIPNAERGPVAGASAPPGSPRRAPPRSHEKPSIVVLPFSNMSSDPEQEYFSDGVSEDLITDLSRIPGLLVIARNSAFVYKERATPVPDVCRELGVRYALEGSIRKAGNRVRITAQLIDGTTGGHIWVERYDRELADIFAVQDDVTREIVSALAPRLKDSGWADPLREPTENLEAYDFLLRGREQWWRFTRRGNSLARSMFERAVELDPDFATAYAWLAATQVMDYVNQWAESEEQALALQSELAQRAVSLDDTDSWAHVQLGMAHLCARQHEPAIREGEKAIALDPNSAHAHVDLAWFLHYAGRSAEALATLDKAERLDPHFPDMIFHLRAAACFQLGDYDRAVEALKRRIIRNPDTDASRVLLAACYGHLGRAGEGVEEWHRALAVNPGYSLDHRRRILPYKSSGDFDRVVDGLRRAGVDVDNPRTC